MAMIIVATVGAAADTPLTNADIVALTKAGLDDGTITAKINQAGRGSLDTSVDALIALKKAGVSKAVIDFMLGVSTATSGGGNTKASQAVKTDVQLITAERTYDLESLQGEPSATYIGVGFLTWLNIDAKHASIRLTDPNIAVRIRSPQRPDSRVFIVKLESNDSDRSVKMGRSRMFSATAGTTPDRDWTIPFVSVEESEGVWKLTPGRTLAKGEYALLRGAELFDFDID